MHKILIAVALLGASAMPAASQETGVDPRAVEACQQEGGTFVQINECLPNAHVAIVALDAFDEIYPAEAAPIKTKCHELNDRVAGAFTCVRSAIQSAIDLAKLLPAGTTLDDPIFASVSSPDDLAALTSHIDEAKKVFPDKMYWGGEVYYPYR